MPSAEEAPLASLKSQRKREPLGVICSLKLCLKIRGSFYLQRFRGLLLKEKPSALSYFSWLRRISVPWRKEGLSLISHLARTELLQSWSRGRRRSPQRQIKALLPLVPRSLRSAGSITPASPRASPWRRNTFICL